MNAAAAVMDVESVPDARQRFVMVDCYGRAWGYQWRRNFGSEARYPLSSLMGRFMREGFMATSGNEHTRTFAEVFLGDGLLFAIALKSRMVSDEQRERAWLHYAVDPDESPAKVKAAMLNIAVSTYWQRVNVMRSDVARALDI